MCLNVLLCKVNCFSPNNYKRAKIISSYNALINSDFGFKIRIEEAKALLLKPSRKPKVVSQLA